MAVSDHVSPLPSDDDAIDLDYSASAECGLPQESAASAGSHDDLGDDSSRIDLIGDVAPFPPSDSPGPTENVGTPPIIALSGEDDEMPWKNVPLVGDESSAVDLGSRCTVTLQFPLGVSSSASSALLDPGREVNCLDSGAVDLLTESGELDLPSSGPSMADERCAQEGPMTAVPMSPASPNRATAWVGGLIGLLTGVAASFTLVFSGVLPTALSGNSEVKSVGPAEVRVTTNVPTARLEQAHFEPVDRPEVNERLAQAEAEAAQGRQAKAELDHLNRLFQQAQIDPAALPSVAVQLARVHAAEDEAQQTRARLDALTAQLQQLADLRAAVEDADAQLAQLREQLTRTTTAARAVESQLTGQLAQLTTAWQSLATFVREVDRRLQAAQLVAPNASLAELLAGLDQVLARRPSGPTAWNSAQAEQQFARGWRAYRGGDYAAAEQAFVAAEEANGRDARYPYFLGLVRLAQGRDAEADFRRGAALERQNLPNAAEVDRMLEVVPRDARLAISRFRP